jgi:hypothetical protein
MVRLTVSATLSGQPTKKFKAETDGLTLAALKQTLLEKFPTSWDTVCYDSQGEVCEIDDDDALEIALEELTAAGELKFSLTNKNALTFVQPASGSAFLAQADRWTQTTNFETVCDILVSAEVTPNAICVGAFVTRGADWHWGDFDGGDGQVGIIVGFRDMESKVAGEDPGAEGQCGLCRVKWPNDKVNSFEMGNANKFSLRLLSPEEQTVLVQERLGRAEAQKKAEADTRAQHRANEERAKKQWVQEQEHRQAQKERRKHELKQKKEESKNTSTIFNITKGDGAAGQEDAEGLRQRKARAQEEAEARERRLKRAAEEKEQQEMDKRKQSSSGGASSGAIVYKLGDTALSALPLVLVGGGGWMVMVPLTEQLSLEKEQQGVMVLVIVVASFFFHLFLQTNKHRLMRPFLSSGQQSGSSSSGGAASAASTDAAREARLKRLEQMGK